MKRLFLLIGLVVFLIPTTLSAIDINDSYCFKNNHGTSACFCKRLDNSVYWRSLSKVRTNDRCESELFSNIEITYGEYLSLGGSKINGDVISVNVEKISDFYNFCQRKEGSSWPYKRIKNNSKKPCGEEGKKISEKKYNSIIQRSLERKETKITVFKSDLPKCKIKKNEIKSIKPCYGKVEKSGAIYEGEFEFGEFNGQGSLTYPKGTNSYIGEWKNGLKHGQGTYKRPSDTYVGEWKDNKRHGQGTATYSSGRTYIGKWKNDFKHGLGTETYYDGDIYVGEFNRNKRNGQGTLTYVDGKIESGLWLQNKLVRKSDTTQTTITEQTIVKRNDTSDPVPPSLSYGKCSFNDPTDPEVSQYPKEMLGQYTNKLKESATRVIFRFIKKKKTMNLYPGKVVQGMAYFEVLADEISKDPSFDKKIKKNIEEGKKSFRNAFNFGDDLSTEEAAKRFWYLGNLIDQGKIIESNVSDDLLQRKLILTLLDRRLNQIRQQINFDTTPDLKISTKDKNINNDNDFAPAAFLVKVDFYAFGHDKEGYCYKGGFNKNGQFINGKFANYNDSLLCKITGNIEKKGKKFQFTCPPNSSWGGTLKYEGKWNEKNNKVTATKIITERKKCRYTEWPPKKFSKSTNQKCRDVVKFDKKNTLTLFIANDLKTVEQYELEGTGKIKKLYQEYYKKKEKFNPNIIYCINKSYKTRTHFNKKKLRKSLCTDNGFEFVGKTQYELKHIQEYDFVFTSKLKKPKNNVKKTENSTDLDQIESKLKFWKKMFDDKLITQEEYSIKRKEILND
jgi:hypothetical protein